jgi:hypothetical protein
MPNKRWIEVRMIVTVVVDLTDAGLADALKTSGRNPSSLCEVIASKVVSNLESLPFVEMTIVSTL